ncbi:MULTISPECIES: carbonic anhydrase family protein [unclassified Rathayibacter]|uniref:carbonic anhydrase n=1 Tax=unclassified Rathayibacter TaxID=2609250 RepID=UPI0010462B32|nr:MULTISPECIES: carbonic anhydrase family protein [unclassified Rathayibacter]TCL83096.1 carbonic anhydrase [Rathayibacter sp. PhB192]TCM28594.1 carbonic anhydrase [Rathayibacter sp. PhB179]
MNLSKTLPLLTASAAAALLLAGCTSGSGTAASTPTPTTAAEPTQWSYEGDSGPSGWGALEDGFATCATGTQQSPIDLPSSTALAGLPLTLDSERTEGEIEDTGHTVQVGAEDASEVQYDGMTYELAQMHVHTPSEHTVDGVAADAEFHFVHQSETGERLVAGVLAVEGAESSAYDAFAENAAKASGTDADPEIDVDVAAMLPATLDHYAYEGSLTTPPCSEGVQWIVLSTPIELSAQQLAEVDKAHPGNTRPAQPLGERTLTRGTGSVVVEND